MAHHNRYIGRYLIPNNLIFDINQYVTTYRYHISADNIGTDVLPIPIYRFCRYANPAQIGHHSLASSDTLYIRMNTITGRIVNLHVEKLPPDLLLPGYNIPSQNPQFYNEKEFLPTTLPLG